MAILGSYVSAISRAAPRQPRARLPDVVGSGLPSPYHFRARIQSFQGVAAPFAGDSVGLSRRDLGDATPRFEMSTIDSSAASSETATQEPTRIEFPSAFRDFSRLCKAENFPSGRNAPPLCRSMAENDVCDRLVPDALSHRPMRAPLRMARRGDLDVVVGHPPAPGANV